MIMKVEIGTAEWVGLFTGFTRSAWRLETLQHYDVPGEAAEQAEWESLVRAGAPLGRMFSRVHVVTEPWSPYIRQELEAYARNVAAGERVSIIPAVNGLWPRYVPAGDFWLFDSAVVAVLDYDQAGRPGGATVTSDPVLVARACQARDAAEAVAVSWQQYMKRAGHLARAS